MKETTLDEVKNHFKNAKEITCRFNGFLIELTDEDKENIYQGNGKYTKNDFYIRNGAKQVQLFDEVQGFADIISVNYNI